MEKKFYTAEELFNELLEDKSYIRGTEGYIYFLDDEVLKLYNYTYEPKNEGSIENLAKLDSSFLTVPKSSVYIDSEFSGYFMQYAGYSLEYLLMDASLDFESRVKIAKRLKEISLYLKQQGIAHGDISLSNIFKDEEHIRLGDVNNIIIGSSTPRLNSLARVWYSYYLDYQMVDTLAVNYLTYLLLNFKTEDLEYLSRNLVFTLPTLNTILSEENQVFDHEVCRDVKRLLYTDYREYKNNMMNLYLIDYLK